jgi:hypothetical protein
MDRDRVLDAERLPHPSIGGEIGRRRRRVGALLGYG